MQHVTLNNGVEMPMVGYGTYRTSRRDATRLVAEAIAVGYRHIDTAQCYGNEAGGGRAIASSDVLRDELFGHFRSSCFLLSKLRLTGHHGSSRRTPRGTPCPHGPYRMPGLTLYNWFCH